MGHVGCKPRSLSQILEKPCLRSRDHILRQILINLGQNVCLDQLSEEFETGSLGQILEKPCVCQSDTLFSVRYSGNLDRMFVSMKS